MPANPITNVATVRAAASADQAFPPGDADGGWFFNETTGAFYADLTDSHTDREGGPYSRY